MAGLVMLSMVRSGGLFVLLTTAWTRLSARAAFYRRAFEDVTSALSASAADRFI
jgi:hypothetical protein